MNSSAARIIPASTATVRSANTVSTNVTSHTSRSVHPCFHSSPISCHSPMLRATTMRMPARTAIGTRAASGAANSRIASSVTACRMPATGVSAPERMLVAVRAMAPVAGRPPTSGDTMLAMPCANSSTLELCRCPVMRSATTADISDSIAPSMATVSVGDSSVSIRSARNLGKWISGRPLGIPPNRDPIVSTLQSGQRRR